MTGIRQTYAARREIIIQAITDILSADKRFLAAWLTGSFARGEQDGLSDIDVTLVVSDELHTSLCAREGLVSSQTTKERYDLFSLFGTPALIHENNSNAPEGGTFTFVAYADDAVMVDWTLRPSTGAQRPAEARLLFGRPDTSEQSALELGSPEQRAHNASELLAFFWMMAAVTVKYIDRRDGVFVNVWLEHLAGLVLAVEREVNGQAWQHGRGSLTQLRVTPDEQVRALRELCNRMEGLKQEVMNLGGEVPASPMTIIEMLIAVGPGGNY